MKNTFKIAQYERRVYEPRGEGSRSVAEVIEHLRRFVKKYLLKNENISWDTHQSILALFSDVKVKKETLDCYASAVFKKIKSVDKYSELNDVQKDYVNTKIVKYFTFMRNKCRDIIYSSNIKSETKELAKFFYNENNVKAFGSVLNFPNKDCIYIVNNTPVISLIGWKFADAIDSDNELYKYVTADFEDVNLSLDAIDPTERFYSQYHYFSESETPYNEPNEDEIRKLYQNNKRDLDETLDSTLTNSNIQEQKIEIWPKVETEHWEKDELDDSNASNFETSSVGTDDCDNNIESEESENYISNKLNRDLDSNNDTYTDDIDITRNTHNIEISKMNSSQKLGSDSNPLDNKNKLNNGETTDISGDILGNATANLDSVEETSSIVTTEETAEIVTQNSHRLCKIIFAFILILLLILLILMLLAFYFPQLRPNFVNSWISGEHIVVDNKKTPMVHNPEMMETAVVDSTSDGLSTSEYVNDNENQANNLNTSNKPKEHEENVPEYHRNIATANMDDKSISYIFLDDASSVRVIISDSSNEVCSINSNLQNIDDKMVLTTNKEETKDKCGFEITKIECNFTFSNCYLVFDSIGWRVAVKTSGITNIPEMKDKETPKTFNESKQENNQKNQLLL